MPTTPPVPTPVPPTADEIKLAELLASMDPEELQRRVKSARVAASRAHFSKHLVDQAGVSAVTLTISDWRSLDLLMLAPSEADKNLGGDVFENLVADALDAIEKRDANRLVVDALLIIKAVKRS